VAGPWGHVGWVTAANDVGVYDLRHADGGSNVRATGVDGFTPLGPDLMDACSLDPNALRLRARQPNAGMGHSLERLDPVQFTAGNHQMRRVLYSACPNRHLSTLIEREWDRLTAIRRSTVAFIPERAREAVAEHNQLLDRLESGASPEEIEAVARGHRMRTARRFVTRWPQGRADR